MSKQQWLAVFLAAAIVAAGPARAGYLDENPDEVFEDVYKRLGVNLPVRAARDPVVWLRLEELKREPCDQKSMTDLSLTLEKAGYRREAAQGLYNFVKACGAPVTALHRSADIFLKLSDHAMVVEVADEFIRRAPDNSNAHYLRGVGLQAIGDHQRALADYANAIELYGNDKKTMASTVFIRMASAYAALDRFCEAASPIQTWVAIDPSRHDTSRTQKMIADYEQRGHCATTTEFQKEKYALRGQRNVVTVKAVVNGVPGTFVLDTGASYVSIKSGFADRAKISRTAAPEITLYTANGPTKALLSTADKVQLGKLEAAKVPILVQKDDGNYGPGVEGLLGMSFLSRFEVQMAGGFIEISTRRRK